MIGIYRAALFKVLIFLCGMCSGSNSICHFSKIVNKIYQKRMEAKNNAYGFDYLAEYNIYKKDEKTGCERRWNPLCDGVFGLEGKDSEKL